MKNLLASTSIAVAALFGATAAHSAVVVSFVTSSTHVAIGDALTINMNISGLTGAGELLTAFDINALFNPAVLSGSVTVLTSPYGGDLAVDTGIGEPSGELLPAGNLGAWLNANLLDDDLPPQGDGFTVLSFQLTGLGDGFTSFGLGSDPDYQRQFVGRRAQVLDVEIGSLCISVGTGTCIQSVPEPTSYALVGAALGAMGFVGRRRRTVASPLTKA